MTNIISGRPSQWTERPSRRNTLILGVAALAVMVLMIASIAVDRLRVTNRSQLERLDLFQIELDDTFGLLRNVQSAHRAYLLTSNETFLEPYTQAVAQYPTALGQLRGLSSEVGGSAPDLVQSFENTSQPWLQEIRESIARRRADGRTDLDIEQALQDKQQFELIRSRVEGIRSFVEQRRQAIQNSSRLLVNTSLVLLLLSTAAALGTLLFGISLVRRIGALANVQQERQKRQESYTQVVSALNGPTQLHPLLTQSLPLVLDSVGAQAGAVYLYEDGLLTPTATVGLDQESLGTLRLNDGLPGRAMQQERVIVVGDLPSDTPYRIHTGTGIAAPRSVANVPLRFGRQLFGVLVVASVQRMNDDDIQQLTLTASQLATALSNVRAFEEMQRIADQLAENNNYLARLLESSDTLQDIGRELVVQSDLQALLDLVCRESRRLLRADYAAVATIADTLGSTRWSAIDGAASASFRDTIFPPHKGTAGRVIDTAAPVVIHDFGQNAEFPVDEFAVHAAEGMKSALGVPLFRKETPIGALILGYRSAHAISDAEIELATALASYASIAIENARLVTEIQTERDLAEQRAHQLTAKNKEVERANRLKSEFVANMSHELRTPLNSILALSQILLDRLDGELNEEQDKQVRIIERNGQNLLRLINDILDLSKIEAGRIELVPSSFKLVDVLGGVRSTITPLVLDKGLTVKTELAESLPPCYTDENKLKQILLNLLSNAVKFTERGTITIAARTGRAVATAPVGAPNEPWLTIEVRDTGIGIASEDQATVWEEFRQIDGSLARHYEGTGLGLAIVRRLVRLLGGDIELESAPGVGSTFRFSIPARLPQSTAPDVQRGAPATTTAVSEPDEAYRSSDRPLVLVVDDDIEVIYILEKYLRDDGYQIEAASTGEEAIAKARQLRPFAMTLDVMLPGRDGWDVIQELKSDPQTSDIQIIMLSMLDNRQLGYSLGATDYLVKPVSRNDLLQRLAQLRDGRPLRNVVVVDDDPIESRVLATALTDEGLQVTAFTSGQPAIDWIAEHTPDLITLDLMMPGMDGFEVLDTLRRFEQLKHVPVLIITAKDIMAEDRVRLNGKIAAIIQKGPRHREELLREVREQLNKHRRQAIA